MGFFDTRKKLTVEVAVSPLVPEKQDFLKNAVLRGTLSNRGIAESIKGESFGGFFVACESMNRRTKKFIGLPEGTITGGRIRPESIIEVLENIEQKEIEFIGSSVGLADPLALAEKYFLNQTGFDFTTGKISQSESLGLPVEAFLTDAEWNDDFSKIIALIVDDEESEEHIEYEIEEPREEGYFLVAYYKVDDEIKIFIYDVSDDTHPKLSYAAFEEESEYTPILPIRENKKNLTVGSEEYENTRKALLPLKIKLSDLYNDLMDESEDNNPDDMNDVFVMFSLDIQTKTKHGLEYFYRYFKRMYTLSKSTKNAYDSWTGNQEGELPANVVEIKSSNYDSRLQYLFINKTINDEVIGKVGKVESEILLGQEFVLRYSIPFFNNSDSKVFNDHAYKIKKQINETQTEEYLVVGLTYIHQIYSEKGLLIRTLRDAVESTEEGNEGLSMFLPVSRTVVDSMSGINKSFVYQEALNVTIYAAVIQRVKWYQTKSFGKLLQVVILIASIYFGDFSGSGFALVVEVAKSIIINMIIAYGLSLALTELVSIFGLENVVILTAVITAVALYYGTFGLTETTLFGDQLVRAVTISLDAMNQVVMNDVSKLMKELENLHLTHKELMEELENEMLELRGDQLDFLNLSGGWPHVVSWESPDMFFNRNLDTNPGIMVFDVAKTYVERQLELPKNNAYGSYTIYNEENDKLYA